MNRTAHQGKEAFTMPFKVHVVFALPGPSVRVIFGPEEALRFAFSADPEFGIHRL